MSEPRAIIFGAPVSCEGTECGRLRCAVVDRVALTVTHLVVDPTRHGDRGHLVPIDLVRDAARRGVELGCSRAHYDALDDAETTDYLPGPTPEQFQGEALQQAVGYHIYGRHFFVDAVGRAGDHVATDPVRVTHDNLPRGEGEVGRGQPVHAADGDIGHVEGLLVEPPAHRVTHVLLAEGHRWGKKEVAIPVSAVRDVFEDGVFLAMTKAEVGGLPAVATRTR